MHTKYKSSTGFWCYLISSPEKLLTHFDGHNEPIVKPIYSDLKVISTTKIVNISDRTIKHQKKTFCSV